MKRRNGAAYWSYFANIATLIIAILVTYVANSAVSHRFKILRDIYRSTVVDTLSGMIISGAGEGAIGHFISAVNSIPGMFSGVYDGDLVPMTTAPLSVDFSITMHRTVLAAEIGSDGTVTVDIDGIQWDIYYRWINISDGTTGDSVIVFAYRKDYFGYSSLTSANTLMMLLFLIIFLKENTIENVKLRRLFLNFSKRESNRWANIQ